MLKLLLKTVYCQPTCLLSPLPHINFQILLPTILIIVKKGIPYSQKLKLNRICSDNSNFDKRCYLKKVTGKKAREHSREGLLEKVKSESNQNKLTSNITYYPYAVFQNVRNILQEIFF